MFYPVDKIPSRLKRRTGKAKRTGFESIDTALYEPGVKMIFHTHAGRIHPWIKACEILYYDNIGEMESMKVRWFDEPPEWSDSSSTANSIVIELSSSNKDLPNPLLYKLTFYISTGTIQVQGNEKDLFTNEHFPILKRLVAMVIDNNKIHYTDSCAKSTPTEVSEMDTETSDTEIDQCDFQEASSKGVDDENTQVKTVYVSSEEEIVSNPRHDQITCSDKLSDSVTNACITHKMSKINWYIQVSL